MESWTNGNTLVLIMVPQKIKIDRKGALSFEYESSKEKGWERRRQRRGKVMIRHDFTLR